MAHIASTNSKYVRVQQASELLSCTEPAIYGMIKRGDLPPLEKAHYHLVYWEREVFNDAVQRLRDRAIEKARKRYRLAE